MPAQASVVPLAVHESSVNTVMFGGDGVLLSHLAGSRVHFVGFVNILKCL